MGRRLVGGLPRPIHGEEGHFICVLEILAQVLALVTLARRLSQRWLELTSLAVGPDLRTPWNAYH